MTYHTQPFRSLGTTGLLLWTTLMAVPPLALAGGLPSGWAVPPQVRTSTTPIKNAMLAACQTECQAMATSMDALRARVQAAQAAYDSAQTRAILDEVLQQQTTMQDHMAVCTHMMGMMPSMPGGMGGHR